jgi:hypothetical protein
MTASTLRTPTAIDFDDFLDRLDGVRDEDVYWTASCPMHDDNRMLKITRGLDPPIVAICDAGCTFEDIIDAAFRQPRVDEKSDRYDDDAARMAAGPPGSDGIRIFSWSDMRDLPPVEYAIDGFVVSRGLSLLYGNSGIGKTFVALDMALSIASGMPWMGRETRHGRVLFVETEGAFGLAERNESWQLRHGAAINPDIGYVLEPVNLLDPKQVNEFIRGVQAFQPYQIFLDPLARLMEGGDENSGVDMGKSIGAMRRIATETGAGVLLVHHQGKNASKKERGHSSLGGALDIRMRVTRNGDTIKVLVDKDRDRPTGMSAHMKLVPIGGSAVPESTAGPSVTGDKDVVALQVLAAFGDEGANHGAWQSDLYGAMGEAPATFDRRRKRLLADGLVTGGSGMPYRLTPAGHERLEDLESYQQTQSSHLSLSPPL